MRHIIRPHRLARLSSVLALLLCSTLAIAQAPAPRIRGAIELTPSVPLQGSLNPHVRLSDDLGPLPPDTPIAGVTLVFKRTPAQETDLQQLLAQQADPSSALYHHWLTPQDFAARFGVAGSDIAATQSWLQSLGFSIDNLSRDRITFSGSATEIQQAFGTELHRFRSDIDTDPELHFAPATELSLPASLAPLTAAVLHLSDFRPQPSDRIIRPDYTTAGNQTHFLDPNDVVTMYDFVGGNTFGQSLAIIGQSFVRTGSGSSISRFQSALSFNVNINTVIVPNSGSEAIVPGDVGESEIDLEYSSALAKSANIFFVYTGSNSNYNAFDALAYAITEDIAPVVSISYGGCEPVMGTADLQAANSLFEQAAAQGQTLVASSGDTGSAACAAFGSGSGVSTTQQQALAVSFPASSPYVTAVGGTQMAPGTFAPGSSNYWSPANGIDNTNSLLGYVPEYAWNENSSTIGLASSGGGVSSIFPRPSWQAGVPGIPSGAFRLVPDVALQASVRSPGYVICTDDPYILGTMVDCGSGDLKASNGQYIISGGTSFGAPIFAAFLANLNQRLNAIGLGNINPVLYSLAAQPPVYASAFHDITSGTTACAIGDGNCGAPGTSAYAATLGYDMATGLGSLDFSKLSDNWPSAPANGAVATYLTVSAPPASVIPGTSYPISISVNIGCGLCTPPPPSGAATILVDGVISTVPLVPPPYPQPLTASATFNFVAPSSAGSHVLVVRYPGDAFHLPSSSTFAVLVGNIVPTGNITLSASNLTLTGNGSGSTKITVTPSGGYSGALTWSSSYTGGTAAQTICYIVQSRAINGPTTATITIGEGNACNSPSPTGSRASSFVQRTSLQQPSKPTSRRAPAAATVVALLLCGLLPSRRTRKLLPLLSTAILAILAITLTGCGSGSSSKAPSAQPQVYTVTVKATDSVNSAITATTSFTLTVNN